MRIIDKDLALVLRMPTRALNQKFKRNIQSFTKSSMIKIQNLTVGGHPSSYYSEEAAIKLIRLCRSYSFIVYQESAMEEWVKSNLEQIEPGLVLISQQEKLSQTQRLDLRVVDKNNTPVIIELQQGSLDRLHVYKSLEYRDHYLIKHGLRPRVILIAELASPGFVEICRIHGLELKILPGIPPLIKKEKIVDTDKYIKQMKLFLK